jgi:hypothetical protein
MTTVEKARVWFADADVLITVENTKRPVLNGTRRRVTRTGASFFLAVMLDGDSAGKDTRGVIPTLASEIVRQDADEITVKLGGRGRLEGHTVTYRKDRS